MNISNFSQNNRTSQKSPFRNFQSPPRLGHKEGLPQDSVTISGANKRARKGSLLKAVALGGAALTSLAGCQQEEPLAATQEHFSIECKVACTFDTGWEQNPEMTALPTGSPRINLFTGEVDTDQVFVSHVGKGIVMDASGQVSFAPDLVNPAKPSAPEIDLTAEVANHYNLTVKESDYAPYHTTRRGNVYESKRVNWAEFDGTEAVPYYDNLTLTNYYHFRFKGGESRITDFSGYNWTQLKDDGVVLKEANSKSPEDKTSTRDVQLQIQDGTLTVNRSDIGVLATMRHDPQSNTYVLTRNQSLSGGEFYGDLDRLTKPQETTISFDGERIDVRSGDDLDSYTSPRMEHAGPALAIARPEAGV